MQTLDEALDKLQTSKFRSSFHLKEKDKAYIRDKGMDTMRGHPVFIAQHATACCCRGCLYKWYKVKPNKALTDEQIGKIVNLIVAWIERECRV